MPPGELESAEGNWERRGLEGRLRGKPTGTEGGERDRGPQGAESRGANPGLQGTKRAIEGRTERGARRIKEEHYGEKRGRPKKGGEGAIRTQPRRPPVREIPERSHTCQGAQRGPEY